MKIFKIQRNTDKLFSCGGERCNFSKKGKMWSALGHVSCHLNYANYGRDMSNLILIEYDINEDDGSMSVIKKTPLSQIKGEANKRKRIATEKKTVQRLKAAIAQSERARELAELAEKRLQALRGGKNV